MWLVGNGKVVIRPRDQTGLMRKMVIGFLVSSSQPGHALCSPCSSAWMCRHVPLCPGCPPPMHLRALPQQAQLLLEGVGVQLSQVRQLADGDALQIEGRVGEGGEVWQSGGSGVSTWLNRQLACASGQPSAWAGQLEQKLHACTAWCLNNRLTV